MTQQLWANEHGPQGGDEINEIKAGANYGWPVVTLGQEYGGGTIGRKRAKGMTDPLFSFVPSIAPSALVRSNGALVASWAGSFLSTALVQRHLNRLYRESSGTWKEERLLQSLNERFRDIQIAADGDLLLVTDSGKVLRIRKSQGTVK